VVLLRDIEELSRKRDAQILDLTTDVVKTRLHRGRLAMRQTLDLLYLHNRCLWKTSPPPIRPFESGGAHEAIFHVARQGRGK